VRTPISLFVETFLHHVDALPIPGLQEDLQWVNVHQRLKSGSTRQYLKFCKEFLEIVLARTEGWSEERVTQADGLLESSGSFTLSELRGRTHRRLLGIAGRGSIRTVEEHAIVRSAIDDSSLALSASLRVLLEQLLASYEARP
jgi:hypothetical protein